jgi:hypothetical protein
MKPKRRKAAGFPHCAAAKPQKAGKVRKLKLANIT